MIEQINTFLDHLDLSSIVKEDDSVYDFFPSETAELEPDKGMEEEGRLPMHDIDSNVIAPDSKPWQ